MPLFDRLTLGPARRRRRLERQWRELHARDEREWPAARSARSPRWTPSVPRGRPRPPHGPRTDLRERLRSIGVLVVTAAVTLTGVAVLEPTLLPTPVAEALGVQRSPLGKAPDVEGPGSYKYLALQRDRRQPVAYDPCRAIHVVYNPEGEPPGGEDLVREAMRLVGTATGLRFVFDGTTTDRPRWSEAARPQGLGRTDPVLVTFADAEEVPELAGSVAGIGGSVQVSEPSAKSRYVTGQVTLDREAFARIGRRTDGREQALAIVLHEFGHLVGLDHVDDENELMNAENVGQDHFGNGDRIGLAALGRGPCF